MKNIFPLFFALLCACMIAWTHLSIRESLELRRLSQVMIPPPSFMEHVAFGFEDPLADLLWIRAIQDLDTCESRALEQPCREGWLFQMLDRATDLSPQFSIVYRMGATALSVLVEDQEGARRLFEKGVQNRPEDWVIAYRAAYHYIYEVGDPLRASQLLMQAARHGAPPWSYSLAHRLLTEDGRWLLAERMIEDLRAQGEPAELIEALQERLDRSRQELPGAH